MKPHPVRIALLVTATLVTACLALARPARELAATPPMGWNSWNWHGKKGINEQIVRETIDALVASGLRDAGYGYVIVDGGWRDTHLGPRGELLAHPVKFPGGMKALADYAHARGLKFGLHIVPGSHDCGGDAVGAMGHEEVQMAQFVEWGLDFIKIDRCRNLTSGLREDNGWTEESVRAVYTKWSDLIGRCGRDMVFSISAYRYRDWYPDYCHMARTTYDITARATGRAIFDDGERTNRPGKAHSIMTVAELNNAEAAHARPGFWNDPDILSVGEQGLSPDEQRSHFALWCIMSAPLMLGNDPRHLTALEKDLLLNREVIAIDQDPTEQGRRVHRDGNAEVWVKKLQGGRLAVLLLNSGPEASQTISYAPGGRWSVRDILAREDLGVRDGAITLPAPTHGCRLLVLAPASR